MQICYSHFTYYIKRIHLSVGMRLLVLKICCSVLRFGVECVHVQLDSIGNLKFARSSNMSIYSVYKYQKRVKDEQRRLLKREMIL